MPERTAEVIWQGTLTEGHGTITQSGSGLLGRLPVSWSARTEASSGKTSPEELLAAAQASCFAMAFASNLTKAGHAPQEFFVRAACTFEKKPEGGWKVATMTIFVQGRVPGIAQADYERIAQDTGQGCPISAAL